MMSDALLSFSVINVPFSCRRIIIEFLIARVEQFKANIGILFANPRKLASDNHFFGIIVDIERTVGRNAHARKAGQPDVAQKTCLQIDLLARIDDRE